MMPSPWGQIDEVEKLCPGVSIVHTPSHGGIRITERALRRYACDADLLIKFTALTYGEYLFFEEDCAMGLLLFDCPRLLLAYAKLRGLDSNRLFEQEKQSVKQYYPKYFENKD